MKQAYTTTAAPKPAGAYSQAVRVGNAVYLAGQVGLNPQSGELVTASFAEEVKQVFANLKAVAEAAGGSLQDTVKLTVYLTDLSQFAVMNDVMLQVFQTPYPARTTVEVSKLPRGARVEMDAVLLLDKP